MPDPNNASAIARRGFELDDDDRIAAVEWLGRHVDEIGTRRTGIGEAPDPTAVREVLPSPFTERGMGLRAMLELWDREYRPRNLVLDHHHFHAFLPIAPMTAATVFDMALGSMPLGAESWLEAAGAVHAEQQALDVVIDALGMPPGTGGVFVQGGTAGNLAGLAVARDTWRQRTGNDRRPVVVVGSEAHSSIVSACHILDVGIRWIDAERLDAATVQRRLADPHEWTDVCAIVGTAGTTNAGIIDALDELGTLAEAHGVWFHVDGAYGAALCMSPTHRSALRGIELADSVVVDPHKWLFCGLDAGIVLYRDPRLALTTHRQQAPYLTPINDFRDINPSDLAVHLTRRARGLPLWAALAAHGLDAFAQGIDAGMERARQLAERVRTSSLLRLVIEPMTGILLIERLGWTDVDYTRWNDTMLRAGRAFVRTTRWHDRPVLRIVVLHPATPISGLFALVESLEADG